MHLTIIVLALFIICAVFEVCEIVSFEKRQKQTKDEDFVKLYRKCHWSYLLLFVAGAADRIIELIEKLN